MRNRSPNFTPKVLVTALILSAAALAAGCDRPASETRAGQALNRSADSVASATDRATAKASAAVDDAAITAKVKSAVIAEPGLKALQINVDTHNAVVTLTGTVADDGLKTRAMQIAQNVEGVRSVVDNLEVKPVQSG